MEMHFGEELGDAVAVARLKTIAQVAHAEHVKGEHDHGVFRRHVKAQSVNTHRVAFEYVNAQVVFQRFRTRLAANTSSVIQMHLKKRSAAAIPKPNQLVGQKKRKGGGGGSWRAYIHTKASGAIGNADVAALGQDYRNRDRGGEENLLLQDLGSRATRLHIIGGQAFGKTTRQVQRLRDRMLLAAAVERACDDDAPRLDMHMVGAIDPLSSATSFDTYLKVARKVMHRCKQSRAKAKEKLTSQLVQWNAPHGQNQLQALLGACPSIAPCVPALQPLPLSGLACFETMFDLGEKASNIAAFAIGDGRAANIGSVIARDWSHRHSLIQHNDQAFLQVAPPSKHMCSEQGFCVCSPEGKLVLRIRNTLLRCPKLVCPRSSTNRVLLTEASLVAKLEGIGSIRSAWSDFAVDTDDGAADKFRFGKGVHWFHVGFMLLSLYRPEFHLLHDEPQNSATLYVWLRRSNTFLHG